MKKKLTKKALVLPQKKSSTACGHDYKNAIKVSSIDYLCPLCDSLLNPLEWFLMNSFEFIDVSVVSKKNFKKVSQKKLK